MDVSILQICLIALWYCFSNISWPFGSMGQWATLNRPLVSGLVVGIILGDPVQGTIIGATIHTIYLGIISAGSSLPSDSGMAGTFGTAIALMNGLDTGTALAFAVPMGVLGALFNVLTMTLQCFFIPLADKWIAAGKTKLIPWVNVYIPYAIKWVFRFAVGFSILYFGNTALDNIITALEGPVLDSLNLMGGLLPAVGIGLMLVTIFKGRACLFLFLGFAAGSYLGLGTIPVAVIFGIIAFLISGINSDDLEAFKAVQAADQNLAYRYVDKKGLNKAWRNWNWFCESCYNYERMQGLGFCNAIAPLLAKIYKDDEAALVDALKRHSMFFNTDHSFGGMIMGVCVSMEEQRKDGADIPEEAIVSLKSGLMGPCAGIGDTLSQVVLLPVLTVIFINLAVEGATWAPVAYTVIFMAIFYGVSYVMFHAGYRSGGETVLKLMESGLFDKVTEMASTLGCAVMGALLCNFVSFNWNVVITEGEAEMFNLQTGVFDAIMPNAMPLILVLAVWYLAKKGVKSSWITFGVMAVGFVLGLLGLIC